VKKWEYKLNIWGNCSQEEWDEANLVYAETEDEACREVFNIGIDEIESYGGLHGLPYDGTGYDPSSEEEDDLENCPSCSGNGKLSREDFEYECEFWLDYKVRLVKE